MSHYTCIIYAGKREKLLTVDKMHMTASRNFDEMAKSNQIVAVDLQKFKPIIQSHTAPSRSRLVQQLLEVQRALLSNVNTAFRCLKTVENIADIFLDEKKRTILKQYDPLGQV